MRIRLPRQVGIVLSSARKSNGLTQAQLARKAGVSRQLVNRLEVGMATGIALDKLMAILDAAGCVLEVYQLDEGRNNGDGNESERCSPVTSTAPPTDELPRYKLDETLFDSPWGGV